MRKSIHFYTLILCIATGLLVACQTEESLPSPTTGERLEFSFASIDGKRYTSGQLENQAYLLAFFHTDCKDCQQELPVLEQVFQRYKDRMAFLPIARNESDTKVAAYWQTEGFRMPYVIPADTKICQTLAPTGIPRIYVVDGTGTVRATFDDRQLPDLETLCTAIETCLTTDDEEAVMLHVRLMTSVTKDEKGLDENILYHESLISQLYLYFYDANTKKLASEFQLEDITRQEIRPSYDMTYLCKTLRIPVGYYDVFAIANYENAPTNIEDEDEFLSLQDSTTFKKGILSTVSEAGAIMTNNASTCLGLDFTKAAGSHLFLTIDMERVVSKIMISKAQDTFELTNNGQKYAEVSLTNYKFINLNTRFYLFRHTARLDRFEAPDRYILPDNFQPTLTANNEYVIDPTFFLKDPEGQHLSELSSLFKSSLTHPNGSDFAAFPSVGQYGLAYILENCSYKTCQKNGYSTGVIFKASVSPAFVFLYDKATGNLVKETRPEYFTETLYLYNFNFYGSLKALNQASGLSLDESKTYTDAELATVEVKQIRFNMGIYETYYTYWIRHNDSARTADMSAMTYAIVRNNYYQLTIEGISGLGDSEIVGEPLRDNQ